jgi:hypothetical protein
MYHYYYYCTLYNAYRKREPFPPTPAPLLAVVQL